MAKQNNPKPHPTQPNKEERGNKGRTTPKPRIKPKENPNK
jgi:hypothetical protein